MLRSKITPCSFLLTYSAAGASCDKCASTRCSLQPKRGNPPKGVLHRHGRIRGAKGQPTSKGEPKQANKTHWIGRNSGDSDGQLEVGTSALQLGTHRQKYSTFVRSICWM